MTGKRAMSLPQKQRGADNDSPSRTGERQNIVGSKVRAKTRLTEG